MHVYIIVALLILGAVVGAVLIMGAVAVLHGLDECEQDKGHWS